MDALGLGSDDIFAMQILSLLRGGAEVQSAELKRGARTTSSHRKCLCSCYAKSIPAQIRQLILWDLCDEAVVILLGLLDLLHQQRLFAQRRHALLHHGHATRASGGAGPTPSIARSSSGTV